MLKTVKNLYRIGKAITIGVAIQRAHRFLEKRYHEDQEDPSYTHWFKALDSVVINSRAVFDKATAELLDDLNTTLKETPPDEGFIIPGEKR